VPRQVRLLLDPRHRLVHDPVVDAALGAIGVEYADEPSETIDYTDDEGLETITDAQRECLWAKTPLTPGQKVWVQIPLWGNDYTFLAGHRIGVVLVGSYPSYPSQARTTPAPAFELNVSESKVTLPVVGGRDQLGF
jgi:X-Pro dipeptidyl-peptidase C-terminal non-catalytic domain